MPNAFEKAFAEAEQTDSSKMLYTGDNQANLPKPVSGRPSAALVEAIRLIREEGYTPRAAAMKVGIAVSTMYRSQLYREMMGKPRWSPPDPKQKD